MTQDLNRSIDIEPSQGDGYVDREVALARDTVETWGEETGDGGRA